MMRSAWLALCLAGALAGAEPPSCHGPATIYAFLDRSSPCCAGPALAGLARLRAWAESEGLALVAVDITPGADEAAAAAAAAAHGLEGLGLRCDPARALAAELGVAPAGPITYVVPLPDGGRAVCASPAQVRRALGR